MADEDEDGEWDVDVTSASAGTSVDTTVEGEPPVDEMEEFIFGEEGEDPEIEASGPSGVDVNVSVEDDQEEGSADTDQENDRDDVEWVGFEVGSGDDPQREDDPEATVGADETEEGDVEFVGFEVGSGDDPQRADEPEATAEADETEEGDVEVSVESKGASEATVSSGGGGGVFGRIKSALGFGGADDSEAASTEAEPDGASTSNTPERHDVDDLPTEDLETGDRERGDRQEEI